ncbi:hypothetical protein [Anatilimnocola floriformis]|uniref:hypothetical protein n=1 Tax=Anatilimnocola floriformis TaxID=2948575 RepID=UPI0020C40091|nr:hypothetical protein [Anatilimnocola floriformis]
MYRLLACTALVAAFLLTHRSAAAQIPGAPAFPVQLRIFEKYDENLATLLVKESYLAERPVTVVSINAAGVEEKRVEKTMEVREATSKYLLAETTIYTVGGKELDRKVAAKEIKKGQPVIMVTPFSKLPDAYKQLFRDDAIILEVKALGTLPDLDGVPPEKP